MDKLQPLIKHHYWICFVLAVIFVVVGWWTASGAIAVATEERKKSVEDSFSKSTQNATEPNQKWVEEATKKNAAEDASYGVASKELWKRQQNARQWSPRLASEMKGIAFRDEIKNTLTRDKWADDYKNEIEALLEIVKPYKNGEGLVDVNSSRITHKPYNSWKYGKPTSTEIWDNQEDIWLLRSLLTSIARVNEGATRITESQVRKIFKLNLRGGDRNAQPGGSGGGMDMMSGGGGANSMMAGMAAMGGGGMAEMGGAGMGGGASHPGSAFEGKAGNDILEEEFGPDNSGGAAAGGMPKMMSGMDGGMFGGGSEGTEGGAAEENRYVDGGADTSLGYKTRAFVLDVLVRDDQLPNLLASLTNSDFPVEIVRVEINSASSSSSSGGGGGMPGMSGMSMSGPVGMGSVRKGGGKGMGMGMGMDDGDSDSGYGGPGGPGESGGAMGMGMGMGMGNGVDGAGSDVNTLVAAKGKIAFDTAMSDPLLVHVKIGGLMTIYQSAQESDAQVAAEAAAATTEKVLPPPEGSPTEDSGMPEEAPVDPAMTGTETPGAETPTAATASEVPAADSTEPATTEPSSPEPANADPVTPSAPSGEATSPAATEPASVAPAGPTEPGAVPAGDVNPSAPAVPDSGAEPK